MLRILLRNRVRYNPPLCKWIKHKHVLESLRPSISPGQTVLAALYARCHTSLNCTKIMWNCGARGPLKALLEAISKKSKFFKILSERFWQISIRISDLAFNFYPNAGYGIPRIKFSKKKNSVSVVSLASGVFSTPPNPSTLIKWRCFIIDFNDFGCLHEISARGYKKYREDVWKNTIFIGWWYSTIIILRLSTKAKQNSNGNACRCVVFNPLKFKLPKNLTVTGYGLSDLVGQIFYEGICSGIFSKPLKNLSRQSYGVKK